MSEELRQYDERVRWMLEIDRHSPWNQSNETLDKTEVIEVWGEWFDLGGEG